jgi:hypothetical protein
MMPVTAMQLVASAIPIANIRCLVTIVFFYSVSETN